MRHPLSTAALALVASALVGAILAVAGCKPAAERAAGDEPREQPATVKDPPVDDDGTYDPKVAEEIGGLFGRLVQQRHPAGTTGVKRAVFLKPHGCARARFEVSSQLPRRFQTGLFAAPTVHDAWVRISSDTLPTTSDLENNTIGLAVKVLGVPGRKILAGEEDFKTQDFLLQNHDVFFVDTAEDFLDFTKAIFAGQFAAYRGAHPRTAEVLDAMSKRVPNVLATRYWSTTPYRFGDGDYAKYTARPCAAAPEEAASAEPNYLRTRLERDVRDKGACFELQVQLREGADMPLDRATVAWSETVSPPETVARITIAPQDIKTHDTACENMSFTAWHALPQHRPVGSVNKARGLIYKQMADMRRSRNGQAIAEPE